MEFPSLRSTNDGPESAPGSLKNWTAWRRR
nr:MAG TPA: hypothetical protein [Caudoviricetes sp.]